MERREELRAADVDREFVAERLKAALNEGRLSLMEYDERLRDTYASKTYGDLDRVLADLPGVTPVDRAQLVPVESRSPTPAAAVDAVSWWSANVPRWLAGVWSAWLVAVSVNVVIWLLVSLTSDDGWVYPWPIWVAGPWGAVLLAITVTGLLSGAPDREADESAAKPEKDED